MGVDEYEPNIECPFKCASIESIQITADTRTSFLSSGAIRLVQKINKGVGYTLTLAASDSHGRLRYLTSSKTCPFSLVVQRFLHVQEGDRLTFLSGSFEYVRLHWPT